MQESSEYETDSEDEANARQLLKPMFVPKAQRDVRFLIPVPTGLVMKNLAQVLACISWRSVLVTSTATRNVSATTDDRGAGQTAGRGGSAL